MLQEIDPQNNQRITYGEIVQLFSFRMVPCYQNNHISVSIVSQEAKQMPIMEKLAKYGNEDEASLIEIDGQTIENEDGGENQYRDIYLEEQNFVD